MQEVDAIIYAPLEEEYKGLQLRFYPDAEINGENYIGYTFKTSDGANVLFVHGFEWGNDAAYAVMNEVFSSYVTKLSVCIGIGGAISNDAKLGDVFYSKDVLDLTQRQKILKDENGNSRIKYDPKSYPSNYSVGKALDRSRLSTSGKSVFKQWQDACSLVNSGTLAGVDTSGLGHNSLHYEKPYANNGKIAATNTVLADTLAVEDVKSCGRKMACVDTESAGFARSCYEKQNSGAHIIVRAISDLADETKKITEEKFENLFREIATSNVALFLSYHLDIMLSSLTQPVPSSTPITTRDDSTKTSSIAIEENEQAIRDELTSRSVVFKTLEQENKMPVPRIRRENRLEDTRLKKKESALEIENALALGENFSIQIPPNYPDNALPWLYAHLLTESNLDDRYTIPVCIMGREFGPPKNDLNTHLELKNLEFAKNNSDYRLVFIFPDFFTSSKTRSKFLSECIEEFDNASIIIFKDRNETAIYRNELENFLSHSNYQIEAISFTSITQYMSASFEIPLEESEVVATRLVSTFNNYGLNAHPTYLASIQKDTVASFIEANQRGELIELAVAGLLSLLVSDDPSQVRLRRTTRESFLSDLAVQIYAEKISYTPSELEEYVGQYAEHMGFDIKPKQFIDSFLNNGILVFDAGHVEIPIPVIRSYMLAKGLAGKPDLALTYFDLDDDDFDFTTFDLYSEFNNDETVQEILLKKLDQSIEFFKDKLESYDSCVMNGEYKSHLLTKTLNLDSVTEDINSQATELVEVTNSLSEKQMHFDVQSEIAQSHTAKEIDVSDREQFKDEHISIVRFISSTIFLGAAAEKLSDDIKIKLISSITELAELVSTDLLTIYSQFDIQKAIEEVVQQIEEDDVIQFDDDNIKEQFSKYVELMVADWQFNKAVNPIMMLISVLCEAGRTNVLLSPIIRSNMKSNLQEFFRTIWAFDMDPSSQKSLPKELSKKLGSSTFLRMVFAISMVNRIYWYHSEHDKKSALANGIDEVLKPISLKSNVDPDAS